MKRFRSSIIKKAVLCIGLAAASVMPVWSSPGVEASGLKVVNTGIAHDKTSFCAMRDSYGFLWVGTMTGLGCFDGNGERVYNGFSGVLLQTEGICVSALCEHGSDIWFGGTQGLYVFHRDSNSMERFPHTTRYGVEISSNVQKIMDVGDGKIWILTHGQGFFIFDTITGILTQDSVQGAFYSDMVASKGEIYATTHDGYLLVFRSDGIPVKRMRLPGFVTDKNPISMTLSGGNVRIAAGRSVYLYRPGMESVSIEIPDAKCGVLSSITGFDGGKILLGSDEGLFSYDTNGSHGGTVSQAAPLALAKRGQLLSDTRVVQLAPDSDGGLIVVTRTGIGFIPYANSGLRTVAEDETGSPLPKVNILVPSKKSRGVWLGTDHGVDFYDLDSGKVHGCSLPLGSDIVVTSLAEAGDTLWVGSRHQGLYLYDMDNGNVKQYTYDENIPYAVMSNVINDVCVTSRGEMFVLTNWGLCRYDRERDNFVVISEIGSGIPFVKMMEDKKGRVWAYTATNDLYVRETPDSRFVIFRSDGIVRKGVSLLYADMKGRLWAVTDGNRLMRYDEIKEDFTAVATPLPKEIPVTFMEEGANGELWIATDEDVVRYDPHTNSTDYSFLTDSDVHSVHGASCRLTDGTVLFGTLAGLCELIPGEMREYTGDRRAYMLSLSFPHIEDSGEELKRLGLDRLLYTLDEITLPYADNTFTVHFAGVRGSGMPRVRYLYKLEGVDKSWMSASGSGVTYTDLDPGTYTLLLRADSDSDATEASLVVKVLSPWYLSWGAIIFYMAVLALSVWLIVLYARRKVRKQTEEKIREMRVEKERETYESKMRFFVNLVHEIRTPLTLISLPLEKMTDSLSGKRRLDVSEERTLVQSMQRNLDYLLGIINQLLDFRKAEQDSEVKLSRSDSDMAGRIKDICRRFEQPMSAQGKKLTVTVPEEAMAVSVDAAKFDRVVMNLLGNAMKYCRDNVWVKLERSGDNTMELTISDDGPGIDAKERDRIFDTYYQISGDDVGATLGTGLGLAYARLIVRAHGGDITVRDNESGGASFCLRLPLETEEESGGAGRDESIEDDMPSDRENQPEVTVGRLTILFVEDNQELRNTVSESLRQYHDVVAVADGEAALEELSKETKVDIIVSDYMMPGIDGAELCRRVKSAPSASYIPFIMLTAKTGREAKEEAMEMGADAFIEKPFSIKQLINQIANIIHTREVFYKKMRSDEGPSALVPAEVPYANSLDYDFLATLNKNILENIYDEGYSIDDIAEKMGVSRSTFYRRLKALSGMSPVEYLKNFRLEYAAKLLERGMRVTEAAPAVGFTSSSYFAKCFRAKFGVTPRDYVSNRNVGASSGAE